MIGLSGNWLDKRPIGLLGEKFARNLYCKREDLILKFKIGNFMGKVLIIDDEPDILELTRHILEMAGHSVVTADDADSGLVKIRTSQPDLLIMDLNLPGVSGWDLLKIVRQENKNLPVILISGRYKTSLDIVRGLNDYLADDYIVKPFNKDILLARVEALLRRRRWQTGETDGEERPALICSGVLEIDERQHLARIRGQPVELTNTEFKILLVLAKRRNLVFNRQQLLEEIWGYCPGTLSRTIDKHIESLRKKLGPAGQKIQTVVGVGYKFVDGGK